MSMIFVLYTQKKKKKRKKAMNKENIWSWEIQNENLCRISLCEDTLLPNTSCGELWYKIVPKVIYTTI